MRKFKKFAAMASAVVLAACAVAPMASLAAVTTSKEEVTNGSITINTAESDHKYTAYQIFDGNLAKVTTTTTDDTTGNVTKTEEEITFSNVVWGQGLKMKGNVPTIQDKQNNDVTIYKALFDLELFKGTSPNQTKLFSKTGSGGTAVALETAEEVAEALKTLNEGTATTYTEIDKVAKVFADYINPNASTPGKVEQANWDEDLDDNDGNGKQSGYKMEISDPGYYLVIDQAKEETGLATGEAISKYILQVAGDEKVDPKADIPKVMKKVYEDEKTNADTVEFAGSTTLDTGYNDAADYSIGETIPFKLYGTLPSTYDNYQDYYYQFNDNMGEGLELTHKTDCAETGVDGEHTKSSAVSADDFTVKATWNENGTDKEYEFNENDFAFALTKTGTAPAEKVTGFTITIEHLKTIDTNTAEGLQMIPKEAVITVEYNAKLNNKAVIGNLGNPNDVSLKYSNNSNTAQGGNTDEQGETPKDYNVIFTYELDVTKYLDKAEDGNEAKAGDAEFKLANATGAGKKYAELEKVTVGSKEVLKFKGWTDNGTVIPTKDKGKFEVSGLQDGTYYLEETKVPTGYNKMEDLEIVIKAYGSTKGTEPMADIDTQAYNTPNTDSNYSTNSPLKELTINYKGLEEAKTAKADSKDGIVEADIVNLAGSALPGTGGIGTTIFYIGGGAMVAVAGVFLITKKRMSKKEN